MSGAADILVTGASGNAGRQVLAALSDLGCRARPAMFTPRPVSGHTAAVKLDFYDRSTWAAALQGIRAVFLMRPPAISDMRRTLIPFCDMAQDNGVTQIVFLSVIGADRNRFIPHHKVENRLGRSPSATILQAGFFAQNFEDAYRRDIVGDARIYLPAGNGKVAFLDLRDLGAAAAQILTAPPPDTAPGCVTLRMTGPQSYDFAQAAGLISAATGRQIRYQPASVAGYMAHLRRRGLPLPAIAVQTLLHVGLRWGQAEAVDLGWQSLLPRAPYALSDYIADHAGVWAKGAGADD